MNNELTTGMGLKESIKSCDGIGCIKDIIVKEINKYEEMIYQFFSKEGKADEIKEMYNKLRDISYSRNKPLSYIDCNFGSHMYQEYYSGMCSFVRESLSILNSTIGEETEQVKEIKDKLDLANKSDSLFVDSLFGGNNNEAKQADLKTAVVNVEYLIDFLPLLKSFKGDIEDICAAANEKCPISRECISLLASSVASYCKQCVDTVLKTYDDIINALHGGPAVEPAPASYKMF